MSFEEADRFYMLRALAEAERGRGSVEPNPMVGGVVVRDGRMVSVGHHERFGGPHAEVMALGAAGEQAQGSTLFITLEPCCHYGKTPPCVDAILRAGVASVVIAMRDPYPKVAGGGIARLRESGVAVVVGLEGEAARRLNAPYLKRLATGRPFVTGKWAMTLDGKIATARGDSRWISGERSRATVHETRGRMDAILMGIGTALADDPLLTARPAGPRVAARVVLDSAARLPVGSRLVRTANEAPVWVAVARGTSQDRTAALAALGCEVLPFAATDRGIPVPALLDELGRRGATNVLVEGGSRVLGAFFDAREIDAVDVYLAPIVEGGEGGTSAVSGHGLERMQDALRLASQEVSVLDGDVRLKGMTPWAAERAMGVDSA